MGQTSHKTTVRFDPEALDVAETASAALGVSRDTFVSQSMLFLRQFLDDQGRPTWWADPATPEQEVLPLATSA